MEEPFREGLFARVPEQEPAPTRPHAGPGAGAALAVAPTGETTIPSISCGVSVKFSSCLCANSDVAVHIILVATVVQLVRGRGCWAAGAVRWRVWRPGPAGRQLYVSGRTCLCDMLVADGRRLEVVVDGVPLQGGVQLAGHHGGWCLAR